MQQLPLDELTGVIARIRGLLLTERKVDRAVQSLAQAVKESLPGTIGAGVSLLDARGRRISSGYTDTVVKRADAAQYEIGQGPCLTAWAAEETVLVEDLAADGRWREWSAAVAGLPVRSVVSVPLLAGKVSLGALKMYGGLPGTYDADSGRVLSLFAGPAATLLSHIQASDAPHRMTAALQESLYTRDLVNRACGMLMERHGITHEAALQQLLRDARSEDVTLAKLSAGLVTGATGAGE